MLPSGYLGHKGLLGHSQTPSSKICLRGHHPHLLQPRVSPGSRPTAALATCPAARLKLQAQSRGPACAAALPSRRALRRRQLGGMRGRRQQQQQQQEETQQLSGELEEEAGEEENGEDAEEGEGLEEGQGLHELVQAQHILVEPDFLPTAPQLRQVFDSRFSDPRSTSRSRFLWDYWHMPQQYTLIRTQAQAYFPKPLYEQLVEGLLQYGESRLGCRAISPIWMSYYIDGCCQELHCDSYHGPYAFVLSLTRWEGRPFTGGETMILKPQVLNFWQGFDPSKGLEMTDLVTLVEPRFNQLTVFDPRFPHGVRPVHGTRDPQQARLVLHGWFTDPSPFFDGPLEEEEALEALNNIMEPMLEALGELPPLIGTLSVRLTISGADGSVAGLEFLADTLVALPQGWMGGGYGEEGWSESELRGAVHNTVYSHLQQGMFPVVGEERGDTRITLPLVFE